MMSTMGDPLQVAGNVYRFVMENEKVRVLNVTFQPGDKAVMHHHPDHVVYIVKGGKMKLSTMGKSDIFELKPGEALFLNALDHAAENVGETTIELAVVELK